MLKIGVFGVGHLGKFHLNNWKRIEGVEVVGFYDPHDQTAEQVSAAYGLKRFFQVEALLQEINAADIVAPSHLHFNLCQQAIRYGKHVFVEKPMSDSMEQAKETLRLVRESNIKFQVGHVERFNPAFQALSGQNINPMFIEVHRLSQFNPRGSEVSVILDLMIHDIDIILHLVKSGVKNINASGVSVMTESPDIANARIEFDNGCVANLTSSRISMKKMRKMRLFQKDTYIGIDFLEKKTEIIRLKTDEDDDSQLFFDIPTPTGPKTILAEQLTIQDNNAIESELRAFRDAILNDTRTPINELDGYLAMEVAHEIVRKIVNGPKAQT